MAIKKATTVLYLTIVLALIWGCSTGQVGVPYVGDLDESENDHPSISINIDGDRDIDAEMIGDLDAETEEIGAGDGDQADGEESGEDEETSVVVGGCFLVTSYALAWLDTPLPIHVGDTVAFHLEPASNSWSASTGCHAIGWMAFMVSAEPTVDAMIIEHSSVENMVPAPQLVNGTFVPLAVGEQLITFNAAWVVIDNDGQTQLRNGAETTLRFPVHAARQ